MGENHLEGNHLEGNHPKGDRLELNDLYTVQANILAIRIDSGKTIYGQQRRYQPHPDDTQNLDDDGNLWVERNDQPLGALVGEKRQILRSFDRLEGSLLKISWATNPQTYRLVSDQDPHYHNGQSPRQVFRKSKPLDLAQIGPWENAWPQTHVLYLQLPQVLQPGQRYRLDMIDTSGTVQAQRSFEYRPDRNFSEAVHVSQVGFGPEDSKIAFLSTWMGDGGGVHYAEDLNFWVIQSPGHRSPNPEKIDSEKIQGTLVYQGKIKQRRSAEEGEDLRDRNYNKTTVYEMRFDAVKRSGHYRVCVETVGCSFEFEIGPKVWAKAFRLAAQGLYHQRSGIELGPPFTSVRRSRPFHPEDGTRIYQSTTPLLATGNGLHYEWDNFAALVAGKTDQTVKAWGGYFDAGDWDRRIQHLEVTRLLLELLEVTPADRIQLTLPESQNELPDVLDEALWSLDFFQRLQRADGGIRGGIESANHPKWGETSWQESQTIMAYAPDVWSSYVYAGVAARAATQMQSHWPERSDRYRTSALQAMDYAERHYVKLSAKDKTALHHGVKDARNLAAVELWRLMSNDPTEDLEANRWHTIFLATTVFQHPTQPLYRWESHDQRDAAFVYARLPKTRVNPTVQANARAALLAEADTSLKLGQQTAFGWTRMEPGQPIGWGSSFGNPKVTTLIRAHALTKDKKYLKAALLGCQFSSGANPLNMTYTTGLGQRFPQHPLVVDQRALGQAPPPGITVYGPLDPEASTEDWNIQQIASQVYPKLEQWPATEAYFDVYLLPAVAEFTVHETLAPVAYAWGYFATQRDDF
ncbi:MAG: hypothetical protein HC771_12825 [Synechococcales cyanobacterium CRU_2_2]|nr:hypothetical protein [Synechococcales cyanobacterium CRU_2_2]